MRRGPQASVKTWFAALPIAERQRAASIRGDAGLVATLLKAHSQLRPKQLECRTGAMRLCERQKVMFDWMPTTATFDVASFPSVRANDVCAYPFCVGTSLRASAEETLLAGTRIGWAIGPTVYDKPDTLFLHSSLLDSPERFFAIMNAITRNMFLTDRVTAEFISSADAANVTVTSEGGSLAVAVPSPSSSSQSSSSSRKPTVQGFWRWSEPGWWKANGYHTFAQFIALHIEVSIWLKYYETCHVDPRAQGCTRRLQFPWTTIPRSAPPPSFPEIIASWSMISPAKRKAAFTKLPEILRYDRGHSSVSRRKKETANPAEQFAQVSRWLSAMCSMVGSDVDSALASAVLNTGSVKSMNTEEMIDSFFSTTLVHYNTPQDIFVKACAVCMMDAHVERLSAELMDETSKKTAKSRRRASAPLPPREVSKSAKQLSVTTAPGTPLTTTIPGGDNGHAPKKAQQQKAQQQQQQSSSAGSSSNSSSGKSGNAKKRRVAGRGAVALDLAVRGADLVHPTAPGHTPKKGSSEGLDLATPRSKKVSSEQVATPSPLKVESCSKGKTSTEALDLAREKKDKGAKQQTSARSHSNPRKAAKNRNSWQPIPDDLAGNNNPFVTPKRLSAMMAESRCSHSKSSSFSSASHSSQQQTLQRKSASLRQSGEHGLSSTEPSSPCMMGQNDGESQPQSSSRSPDIVVRTRQQRSISIGGSDMLCSGTASPMIGRSAVQPIVPLCAVEEQANSVPQIASRHSTPSKSQKRRSSASSETPSPMSRPLIAGSNSNSNSRSPSRGGNGANNANGIRSKSSNSLTSSGTDSHVSSPPSVPWVIRSPSSERIRPLYPSYRDALLNRTHNNGDGEDTADELYDCNGTRNLKQELLDIDAAGDGVSSSSSSADASIDDFGDSGTPAKGNENCLSSIVSESATECPSDSTASDPPIQRDPTVFAVPLPVSASTGESSSPSTTPSGLASGRQWHTGADGIILPMRGRADTGGGEHSWNPRNGGMSMFDYAPGEDVSDSASPLSPSPDSHSPFFNPLSPGISPRFRRSRSPHVNNLDLADTQFIFRSSKSPGMYVGTAVHLDLAYPVFNPSSMPVGMLGSGPYFSEEAAGPELAEWISRVYTGTLEERLSQEINDFTKYIMQDAKDRNSLFVAMKKKVVEVIDRVLPGAKVEVYGSYATGLCIPSSDLDLVCCLRSKNMSLRPSFRRLANELRHEKWVKIIKPIETASVPVIKVMSYDEELPTDISFDAQESGVPPHRGVSSVEMAKRYIAENPKLRPLVLIVKEFLSEKGLNNTYTGGLGSYCLIIMARTFLHMYHTSPENLISPKGLATPPASSTTTSSQPRATNSEEDDIGKAVLAFFKFYGTEFDYATMGISTKRGGVFYHIGDIGYYNGTAPLVIEDPFDPMSNIASGVFSMWRVKAAFESAYLALTENPTEPCRSLLMRIIWKDE